MAWVSSAFDDVNISVKGKKRNKSFQKSSKKICMNSWVDEFPPLTLDEVAIHKKKLQEIKNWITESKIRTKERRILLLTGPPGSSKSAVIHALVRELNLSLREWVNTYTSNKDGFKEFNFTDQNIDSFYKGYDADYSYSQSERFSDFIFKASKYKDLSSTQASMSSLILIEEIPNVFILNPIEFHQLLRKYSVCCTCPIVFIISETNNNNLVKSLFPVELQDELCITNICCNPVSSSLLQNALNRIVNLTSNANSSFFDSLGTTKKQFFQTLAEKGDGDVRSAINTLQFIMTKGEETDGVLKEKRESKKRAFSVEDFVGRKDSSLVLFRALGKVLYCKREKSLPVIAHQSLPKHLQVHERDLLIENPEDVFERSDSTPSSFNLFLHQNCIPFFSDIKDYSAAIGYLSDGDIFNASWDPTHSLESYASSVSIRGMMHSLKGDKITTQTFRSLSRPAIFNVAKVSNERLQKVKHLNKHLPLGTEELTAVYVPLISKIFYNSENIADQLIKEIGLIYSHPACKISNQVLNSSVVETFSQHAQELDEDEFVIEEFDD